MDVTARITIRLYINGQLTHEDACELAPQDFSTLLPKLAEKHAAEVRGRLFMVEIEFHDDPNPDQRFFRFGSDTKRMVAPVAVPWKEMQA